MAIHEVLYYRAKCDCCRFVEDDYDDFSARPTPRDAIDEATIYKGWIVTDQDELLCPDCFDIDGEGEFLRKNKDHEELIRAHIAKEIRRKKFLPVSAQEEHHNHCMETAARIAEGR